MCEVSVRVAGTINFFQISIIFYRSLQIRMIREVTIIFSLVKCFLFSVTPGNNNGSQEFGSLKQMVEVLCCHPGQNRCWLKEI